VSGLPLQASSVSQPIAPTRDLTFRLASTICCFVGLEQQSPGLPKAFAQVLHPARLWAEGCWRIQFLNIIGQRAGAVGHSTTARSAACAVKRCLTPNGDERCLAQLIPLSRSFYLRRRVFGRRHLGPSSRFWCSGRCFRRHGRCGTLRRRPVCSTASETPLDVSR
jgi:hypothetical protein